MIQIFGTGLTVAERQQFHLMLNSLKNQSFESKSVQEKLLLPMEAYTAYKTYYGKNIQFDPIAEDNFCKYEISTSSAYSASLGQMTQYFLNCLKIQYMSHSPLLTASVIPPGELQVVQVYFDTSTFDEIERDVKVTIE